MKPFLPVHSPFAPPAMSEQEEEAVNPCFLEGECEDPASDAVPQELRDLPLDEEDLEAPSVQDLVAPGTFPAVAIAAVEEDGVVAWGIALEDWSEVFTGLVEGSLCDGYLAALKELLDAEGVRWDLICPHEGITCTLQESMEAFPALEVRPWHEFAPQGYLARMASRGAQGVLRDLFPGREEEEEPSSTKAYTLSQKVESIEVSLETKARPSLHITELGWGRWTTEAVGEEEPIVVATDGSLGMGSTGTWSWISSAGVAQWGSVKASDALTAELAALLAALHGQKKRTPLEIHMDSRIGVMIAHALQRGVTSPDELPAMSQTARAMVYQLVRCLPPERPVKVRWVKGHQVTLKTRQAYLNDGADRLALSARRALRAGSCDPIVYRGIVEDCVRGLQDLKEQQEESCGA